MDVMYVPVKLDTIAVKAGMIGDACTAGNVDRSSSSVMIDWDT